MTWQDVSFDLWKYSLPILGMCLACPGEPHNTAIGLVAHATKQNPTFLSATLLRRLVIDPHVWPYIHNVERRDGPKLMQVLITAYLHGGKG